MSLTKIFKTDAELESQGAKFQLPANDDGSVPAFYLARMSASNKKFTRTLEAATKPVRRQMQLGILPEADDQRIDREVFVDSILTGWDNIPLSDVTGAMEDVGMSPFNRANALLLLERLPELCAALKNFASNMGNYLEANREYEAKN